MTSVLGADIQNFDKKLILPTVNDTANGVRKKSSQRLGTLNMY